ncbi:TetR/AcrR family transcriptional regulator [Streptomyces sp. NPDC093228]|uniref:TetR/AcrR family transcriptional regulator n=1 Tax=Streptomyces sp. NPDC093228 TaxID=3155070 RepID=UPI003449B872
MKQSARERLLAAADELFYAEGVQTVGVDRIIEHAGVAKASLYNIFGGKEQLIRAYLDGRHAGTTDRLVRAIQSTHDPRERVLAVFDAQGEFFTEPDFHGCAFVTASAEAKPSSSIEEAADGFRAWIRNMFTQLVREAGVSNPEELAVQLQLLYDGAGLAARMDRSPAAAAAARAAAAALLDSVIPARRRKSPARRKVAAVA